MKYKKSLVWFRRDLRLSDHVALYEACKNSSEVVLVFLFDTNILDKLKDREDRRVTFIYNSLLEIEKNLKKVKSRLVVLRGDPVEQVPALAHRLEVDAVFTNEDYEAYAKARDKKVSDKLSMGEIEFLKFKDQVIFSSSEVLKSDGTPYQVFTPYKKAWLKAFKTSDKFAFEPELKKAISATKIKMEPGLPSLKDLGFIEAELKWAAGENAANELLKEFVSKIANYAHVRDVPAAEGTSNLSVHLRFGTLSIRRAVALSIAHKGKGPQVWLSELIWRDFYFMILDQFPRVENEAFKNQYNELKWPGQDAHFKAWCDGQTGFPLVDAGMRQLNKTGYMHNRLRMITACFLVKDLLIDWRKGEAYFAEKLLDFDKSANNGGWQWCASTGCDAQPYFRIFNPNLQAKKFDPDNAFVKKWVPEAFDKSAKYPKPIVDHNVQRNKAIELFKNI